VDRTKIVNAACERIKKGGPDGRALFLRLHFMSQRLHSAYIEYRLRDALAIMPEDDRAILEFFIQELDNSNSVFFFNGEKTPTLRILRSRLTNSRLIARVLCHFNILTNRDCSMRKSNPIGIIGVLVFASIFLIMLASFGQISQVMQGTFVAPLADGYELAGSTRPAK